MLIDLTALLRGETHCVPIDADITPESAPDGITLLPGAHITGRIEDNCSGKDGEYIRLTAAASVPYHTYCARCLDPVEGVLNIDFDRTLVTEGVLSEEQLEEDADEYLLIRHGTLDIGDALSESVYLEFPTRFLCSPDCAGLCQHCGRKLKPGEVCSCTPAEVDPRWEALRGIRWDDDQDEGSGKSG